MSMWWCFSHQRGHKAADGGSNRVQIQKNVFITLQRYFKSTKGERLRLLTKQHVLCERGPGHMTSGQFAFSKVSSPRQVSGSGFTQEELGATDRKKNWPSYWTTYNLSAILICRQTKLVISHCAKMARKLICWVQWNLFVDTLRHIWAIGVVSLYAASVPVKPDSACVGERGMFAVCSHDGF